MEFRSFEPDIEVNGQTVLSVVHGMATGEDVGRRLLAAQGIEDPQPGQWYGQQAWLDAFKAISDKIGMLALRKIGTSIPENADWPPHVTDVHSALSSIDVAYHLNHRRNGRVMMDLAAGTMAEGIGHYAYTQDDDRRGTMVCHNPYPCEFDFGIIGSAANKFSLGSFVKVSHASGSCRKDGADVCTYDVSW